MEQVWLRTKMINTNYKMMMTMTMIKNDVAPTKYDSISSFNFIIQSDLSAVNKCSTCS